VQPARRENLFWGQNLLYLHNSDIFILEILTKNTFLGIVVKNVTLASAHVMTHPTRILFTSANFRNKDPPPQSICANEQTRLSAEKSHHNGRGHSTSSGLPSLGATKHRGEETASLVAPVRLRLSRALKGSRAAELVGLQAAHHQPPWHLGNTLSASTEVPPLQELPRQRGGVSGLGGGGLGCTRSSTLSQVC